MPALEEKTRRARAELEEALAMMVEIEKEGLNFAQSEAERRHCLFMRTLHRRKD
jgi:multidrug resistance efflux pump